MSDRPENRLPISVDIGAKATLEIKAEIPKESTGRLVDALTEIIRPFSEARGLKADLLRLQREEVAIEIARKALERLAIEQAQPQPVARKILVPLMEKGSCEDAADASMIQRWANLLASASSGQSVQPRFVGILGELAGSQAECLEHIAFNNYKNCEFPLTIMENSYLEFAEHNFVQNFQYEMSILFEKDNDLKAILGHIVDIFSRPGSFLELAIINPLDGEDLLDYDVVAETGVRRDSDLSVLESLGLILRVVSSINFGKVPRKKSKKGRETEISVYYFHLTQLGYEFCEVCARPRVLELGRMNEESAQKRGDRET